MRVILLGSLLVAACVRYTAAPIDTHELEEELAQRQPGTLDFEAALAYARLHNPSLKRLRAEAEAAGLDIPATSIGVGVNTVEKRASGFVDPVALLKLGPRGARAQAAVEREAALLAKVRERDLEVAAAIAEVFLTERVLDAIALPKIDAEPALFEKAGLASSPRGRGRRSSSCSRISRAATRRTAATSPCVPRSPRGSARAGLAGSG